jgi:branched-subunit amino acid ABC-type transport system permease component
MIAVISWDLIKLAFITGLGFGSIYIVIGMSYTLVLAASGVFNFALASVVMGGAVGTYVLRDRVGLPLLLALCGVLIAGAVVGGLSDAIAVRPFLRRSGHLTEEALVTTLGLGLAFAAFAELVFGPDSYRTAPYTTDTPIDLGGVPLRPVFILTIVSGAAITITLDRVMAKTNIGSKLRATIADREGAALFGIDPNRVIMGSFVLAGALGALAGFLLLPLTTASVFVGSDLSLIAFVAMALGGFGSFRGVIIGGVAVGMVVAFTPVFLDSGWNRPVLFIFMLVMLIVRPRGLFGSAGLFGAGDLREV